MTSVLQRWSGPLLALPGLLGIGLIAWQAPGERSTTAWWILTSALSVERIVPLLGLGVAVSLLGRRQSWAALGMFVVGIAVGFEIRPWFMDAMAGVPRAADHLFLTGPLSNVAAGLLLIAPRRARARLFAPVMLFTGAMLAIAIELTDPTIDDLAIPCAGVIVAVWIISAVGLSASLVSPRLVRDRGKDCGELAACRGSSLRQRFVDPASPRSASAGPAAGASSTGSIPGFRRWLTGHRVEP